MTFFYNQWFYLSDKVKVIEKYQMWILAKTIAEVELLQGQGLTPAPVKVGRGYHVAQRAQQPRTRKGKS